MTSPDGEDPSQGAGRSNPFDTGLPMVRIPAEKPSKRRRGPRRRPIRRREAELDLAEAPRPPDHEGPRVRLGEWEHWLDPAAEPSVPPPASSAEPGRSMSSDPEPPGSDDDVPVPGIVNRSGFHPGTPVRRPRRTDRGGNRTVAVLLALGMIVVVVSIALTVVYGSGAPRRTAAPSATLPAQAAPVTSPTTSWAKPPWAIATPGCEQRRTPEVVSGTDPGGTGNGPDAILAFEYAYYAERSGYRARAVVAPDAAVSAAEQIQRGIDQVPVGTRYCAQITRAGDAPNGQARWEVRLTQQFPGEPTSTFTQIVTTRTGTSQTLITGIAPADEPR